MRFWALVFRRFWEKIKNIRPQNVGSLFLVLIIVGGIFLWIAPTFANEGLDEASNWLSRWISGFFLSVGSLCLQLTLFALKMFILVAGYNNYINAPVVQFGWNIIRDVANMFFVVILLVIAFGTILGLEQYEWRKTMAKLVFASIFVNFSNVICQLIIDVSQVFTMTFLNAVAGTAAGNMIQMFSLQSVFQLVRRGDGEGIGTELMIASLFAMIFTIIALCAIGSYLIVMLYRMVVLWCLIILSPLAFIFSILPGTKSYASDFWKEFSNHVLAAPIMVFFLWLAFSTFGGGDIVQSHIEVENPSGVTMAQVDEDGRKMGASVSAASSWDNLANFVVAVAFLFMGMERVQKLGVKGGEFVQKGMDLGKKAVSYASGYRAAKWTGGKAVQKTPFIGTDSWKRRGRSIAGWAKGKHYDNAQKRDNFAANLEKSAQKDSALNPMWIVKRMGAAIVESGARKEKRAKTWEDGGESAKKEWDERVSLGHTAAGKNKLTRGVKVEIAQEKSAQARNLKFAEERTRLGNPHLEGSMEKAFAKAKLYLGADTPAQKEAKLKAARAAIAGGYATVNEQKLVKKDDDKKAKIAKAEADEKAYKASQKSKEAALSEYAKPSQYGQLMQETADTELKAGLAQGDVQQAQAQRKDKSLKDILKQAPRHEIKLLTDWQEDLEKQLGSLTDREAEVLTANYAKQLNGNQSDTTIGKNLVASLVANMKRGAKQGAAAMEEALSAIGWKPSDEQIQPHETAMERDQRKAFSIATGKVQTDAAQGETDFKTLYGDSSNVVMKQLDQGFRRAAQNGLLGVSAIINDRDVDPSSGRIKYSRETNHDQFEKNRESMASVLGAIAGQLQSLGHLGVGTDSAGKFRLDDTSIKQLAMVIGGMHPNQAFAGKMIESLKQLQKDDAAGFTKLKDAIEDKSGNEALKRFVDKLR